MRIPRNTHRFIANQCAQRTRQLSEGSIPRDVRESYQLLRARGVRPGDALTLCTFDVGVREQYRKQLGEKFVPKETNELVELSTLYQFILNLNPQTPYDEGRFLRRALQIRDQKGYDRIGAPKPFEDIVMTLLREDFIHLSADEKNEVIEEIVGIHWAEPALGPDWDPVHYAKLIEEFCTDHPEKRRSDCIRSDAFRRRFFPLLPGFFGVYAPHIYETLVESIREVEKSAQAIRDPKSYLQYSKIAIPETPKLQHKMVVLALLRERRSQIMEGITQRNDTPSKDLLPRTVIAELDFPMPIPLSLDEALSLFNVALPPGYKLFVPQSTADHPREIVGRIWAYRTDRGPALADSFVEASWYTFDFYLATTILLSQLRNQIYFLRQLHSDLYP